MTAHTMTINGVEVDVTPTDADFERARLMLAHCADPHARKALAERVRTQLAELCDEWVAEHHDTDMALTMARVVVATELLAGGAR